MNIQNNVVVDRTDGIACEEGSYPGRAVVEIRSPASRLGVYFDLPALRRLHRAVGDYLEGPDGSADRADICRPDAEAESLESLALNELEVELTRAAQDVGIDPDGMDNLEVIRALVRRATDRRDIVPAEAATGCEERERGF